MRKMNENKEPTLRPTVPTVLHTDDFFRGSVGGSVGPKNSTKTALSVSVGECRSKCRWGRLTSVGPQDCYERLARCSNPAVHLSSRLFRQILSA
jgi:hypothetical protein